MKNQIEIVKDIADGMIGIGGIPSNESFYVEFDMRLRDALNIKDDITQIQNKCNGDKIVEEIYLYKKPQ
jgi:hypothetical protein